MGPWKCCSLSGTFLNQWNEPKTPPMIVSLVKCIQNVNLMLTPLYSQTRDQNDNNHVSAFIFFNLLQCPQFLHHLQHYSWTHAHQHLCPEMIIFKFKIDSLMLKLYKIPLLTISLRCSCLDWGRYTNCPTVWQCLAYSWLCLFTNFCCPLFIRCNCSFFGCYPAYFAQV